MLVNEKTTQKTKYYLATAFSRFFSRIIDDLIVLILFFVISVIIFSVGNEKGFIFWEIDFYKNINAWKYFLFSLICFIVSFLYFIVLPLIWNGKTLGLFLFKLTIVNVHITRKFVWCLIKREFLIWETFSIISLCLGITLFSIGNDNAFLLIKNLINIEKNKYDNISTLFDSFFYVSGITLLILIIVMFLKNKKRCIQDFISDTVTVKINSFSDDDNVSTNKKTVVSYRNYGLPTEIGSADIGEIEKI